MRVKRERLVPVSEVVEWLESKVPFHLGTETDEETIIRGLASQAADELVLTPAQRKALEVKKAREQVRRANEEWKKEWDSRFNYSDDDDEFYYGGGRY